MAKLEDRTPHVADGVPASHVPGVTTETHPRYTRKQQREHSRMRHAADDSVQRAIWVVFFALIASALLLGVFLGLKSR